MPAKRTLRLGSRGSRLARRQTDLVADRLRELGIDLAIDLIETTGDRQKVADFGALGAKGVFVKEIEAALLARRLDLAVHSLKDLPTALPDGLVLGAVLPRASPFDAWVPSRMASPDRSEAATTVATGSLRRAAQLRAVRPELRILPLRGNVPTRLRKIDEGAASATVLAVAGLERLDLADRIGRVYTAEEMTPAMGQGALAVEARRGEFGDLLSELEDPPTRLAVEAERAFLARVGGGCLVPVGVLAQPEAEAWRLTGMIASPDGGSLVRLSRRVPGDSLRRAAEDMAEAVFDQADDAIRSAFPRAGRRGFPRAVP